MYIYIYIYMMYMYMYMYMHMHIYIYIYYFGGEWNQRESLYQFVHKPVPGIPTSSTPNQQPAQTMPQVGEGATPGPKALYGGGHTHILQKFKHPRIQSFRLAMRYYPVTSTSSTVSFQDRTDPLPHPSEGTYQNSSCCPSGAQCQKESLNPIPGYR